MSVNPSFEAEAEDAAEQEAGGVAEGQGVANAKPNGEETAKVAPRSSDLLYKVDESPPWSMCLLLGLQHYLTMATSSISIPFILVGLFCIEESDPARGHLVSTIIFVSGIITLLQTTFGCRLPIVQGGTASFIVPTIAIITTSYDACDALPEGMTEAERQEVWQQRMREIQGAIAVSALFQILMGFTGLIGLLIGWITPLVITPTVTLVGLSLSEVAAQKAALHWGLSGTTMVLLVLFSQYLREVGIPMLTYSRAKGFSSTRVYVFKLFPVLLAVLVSWVLCAVLTSAGVFPEGSKARSDASAGLIASSPWFRIPYPGQWGLPTVTVAGVFGMLAGVIASIIESVGDYYACARLAGAPPPPIHVVNRGIGTEGLGCLLAGIWGTGNGTTSYAENIGIIGVTKVGSRRVVQYAALFMIVFGMLGKIGALFASIPEPVVGGVFCIIFGMVAAVGLSSLQFVDLNSSRNLFVLGVSIFIGLALPKWLQSSPGAIRTGSLILDQLLTVLLQTSMFVGGFLGFLLDNTIPGTPEERGLLKWKAQMEAASSEDLGDRLSSCYDLPFGMGAVRRAPWTSHIPFSPTFTGFARRRRRSNQADP
ncbi:solute carrier family 23 member 2-like [Penaeus japonicus]|uniref:solute carrier family 23 member 2-like n=1 Tax=Penaeus japonicus TaxID=27405 RepID=UPI001C714BF8|nr:solute carrier family 23 member 2-like [Penaeus japonicus]